VTRTPVTVRELALLIPGAVALALAMHWPLPLHMGRDIPNDLGDPLAQAWQVAWIGHALLHHPGDLFQANVYWPLHDTLAFTDALIGYAPVGMLVNGPEGALVGYNLLFLFAYALAFIGAYLLARELGVGPAGAAVAGAAFAYAPWRLGQDGHLNILSSGGIPLAVFLLLRGYRRASPGTVLAGWLVATWQLLLGISLGIQLAYLLLVLGAMAVVYWYQRRPPLGRGVVAATVAGVVVLVLCTAELANTYLRVRDDHPESERTLGLVALFSPPVRAYLWTSDKNLVWGSEPQPGDGLGTSLRYGEHTLFPGLAILTLVIVGTLAPVYPRRRRTALAIAVVSVAVLSLGYTEGSRPIQPYKLVYDYFPGWDGIRVPSRLNTLTSLGLALLAAAGAQQLVGQLSRFGRRRRWSSTPVASTAAALLVAVIALEGSGFQLRDGGVRGPPHPAVPSAPSGQLGAPAPQLHLPLILSREETGDQYVFWSTDGFPEIVNGWGGFVPNWYFEVLDAAGGFPNLESATRLRSMGVRTVIVHSDFASGTPLQDSTERSVRGLPLRREVRGQVVLYHLKY
jgi:hypothetical protein